MSQFTQYAQCFDLEALERRMIRCRWLGVNGHVIDEFTYMRPLSYIDAQWETFEAGMKAAGLEIPKRTSETTASRERFFKYATKRGRSNHPHNVRWKAALELQTLMKVIDALERK